MPHRTSALAQTNATDRRMSRIDASDHNFNPSPNLSPNPNPNPSNEVDANRHNLPVGPMRHVRVILRSYALVCADAEV